MSNLRSNQLSPEERRLLEELQAKDKAAKAECKEAFEGIRMQLIHDVKKRFYEYVQHGKDFTEWLRGEAKTYYDVLVDYGKLKRNDQLGFQVGDDTFRLKVKGARIKGFDERADIAEKRLVDFLNAWIGKTSDGERNPMYKLAMAMIQRNEMGDLDYKSISRLYELESDFADPEYSEIMDLFRESNVVEGTVINFYFEEHNEFAGWRKVEPSFNRFK